MIPLSLAEVVAALGARVECAESIASARPIIGVSTDSRTVRPGELFVALKGDRFDGHDFVGQALAAGAQAAVVEESFALRGLYPAVRRSGRASGRRLTVHEGKTEGEIGNGAPLLVVPDALRALGALARYVRQRATVKVIGVTGSVGKTSTKDLLRAMAGSAGPVVATKANQNNEIGVPLTLLAIEPRTELVVVEMAMRGHGQIAELCRIAEPDVGLITNVAPVHLELVGSLDGVVRAKAEMILGLRNGGVPVIPAWCRPLRQIAADVGHAPITFCLGDSFPWADIRGVVGAQAGGATRLRVAWPDGEREFQVPFSSRYRLENTVAAAAACYAAGLSMDACLDAVKNVVFSPSRGEELHLCGMLVLNDTYNANPLAMRAALDDLRERAAKVRARPVAVLGDMLELGSEAVEYHREIGAYAARSGVQVLWGIGELSKALVEAFQEEAGVETQARIGGPKGEELELKAAASRAATWQARRSGGSPYGGHLSSLDAGLEAVLTSLKPGDIVLVKGSRGMRLERVVEALAHRFGAAE